MTAASLLTGAFVGIAWPASGFAQTQSAHDTATAYGARLNARGQPADVNQRRVNSRIPSRIDSRLVLRIERYRVDSTNNPAAAFQSQAAQTDKTRTAPDIAPPPAQDDTDQ